MWINRHKAGSPTDPSVYWIPYRPKQIQDLFAQEYGISLSQGLIRGKLVSMGFKYRKMCKNLATGTFEQRDEQFNKLTALILSMHESSPILSIDCKKKERLGHLYRDGKNYATQAIEVYDHDYDHLAQGKVIPHGIYDLQRNEGYMTIGNSHETATFICENLLWWWETYGIHHYPDAQNILILCDAGGANSYRHHAFKQALLDLSTKIGKNIIIGHYPPYASKWNPIEHRLFAPIHRAMQGVVFDTYETVKMLIEKTTTKTGLKVFARILDKHFEIGIKVKKEQLDFKRIQFNTDIPNLSYRIVA